MFGKRTKAEKPKKSKLRENIETIVSAILIALLVRIFIIEAYEIPTGSMIPTLIEGDRLLVNKFVYGVRIPILGWKLPAFSNPERGDITVFHFPKYRSDGWPKELLDLVTFGVFRLTNNHQNPKNFIKRTVATPGDILKFQDQKLTVNGKELSYTVNINSNLKKRILDIHNTHKPNSHRHVDVPKDKVYYSVKQKRIIGYQKEFLLSEKIDDLEHIIQVYNTEFSNENFSFLYIPKKGDVIEIRLDKSVKQVFFKVNNKDIGSLDYVDFAGHIADFYSPLVSPQNKSWYKKNRSWYKKIEKEPVTIHVDADYYFMMGDNRDNSHDSRFWGMVHEKYIIGTPLVIYWPFDRFGYSPD